MTNPNNKESNNKESSIENAIPENTAKLDNSANKHKAQINTETNGETGQMFKKKNKKQIVQVRKNPSKIISDIYEQVEGESITVEELEKKIGIQGFYFLIFLVTMPISLPIPIPPGFHTIFAIPVLSLLIQILCGKESPWFPKKIKQKTISKSAIEKLNNASQKYVVNIEKFLKPRSEWVCSPKFINIQVFIMIICAISIIIPLPLTNWIPSIGISFISLGILSNDGKVVLIGDLIAIIGILIAASSVITISFLTFKALKAVI